MNELLKFLFAPGFFQNLQVRDALLIGTLIAATSGLIGVFVIIRRQSFAGHAISDFGGAGAAVAFLLGLKTVWGFLGFGLLSALGIELLGKREGERDLATGIVLSIALGCESLFLFLGTHYTGQGGAPMMVLFGSIFMMSHSTLPIVLVLAPITVILLILIFKPLLLSSINAELAQTRGIPVRLINYIFIILLALVVNQNSMIIGSLLSTALLIGPAAIAMRLTHRIGKAMILSAFIGLVSIWIGIVLAYDSYQWLPSHKSWPVSFFVCAQILLSYFISGFIQNQKLKRNEKKAGAVKLIKEASIV
ncbi:MAG TPA: metal ABC transporter permease [Lactovum miscens]|uniref:metal ABC transporter permease n=1 Tax=Lactovum miscens TaxID=190387 RepID=UPI002ED79582